MVDKKMAGWNGWWIRRWVDGMDSGWVDGMDSG